MRHLLSVILLLGAQSIYAQSILKDKDEKDLSVLPNEAAVSGVNFRHTIQFKSPNN